MLPYSTDPLLNLREEGARCKSSLEAFTENLIAKLGIPQEEAERLRKYDTSRKAINMYLHFPFCFWEAYPDIALEDMRTIALSGVLWMSYMRAQDDRVDNPRSIDPVLLFLRDLYLRQSLYLLHKIFAHSSKFWELYSLYFDEYARAVLRESRNHSSEESHYNEEEFCSIAKGKAAMAKYPVAALSVLSGHDEKIGILTESLDCFHVGYQYWDDLVDWREDSANSKYSLLLVRTLEQITPDERKGPPDQVHERIGRVLYSSGLAEDNLHQSYKWLQRAYELSLTAGCTVWADYVKRLQKQTVVLADDLRSMIAKEKARIGVPSTDF